MAATPADSVVSTYFDAPIANFHSSSSAPTYTHTPTLTTTNPTTTEAQQQDMSTIASPRAGSPNALGVSTTGNPNGLTNGNVEHHNNDEHYVDENEPITSHPNGSAGWLPATDLPEDGTTANNTNANGGRFGGSSILKRNSVLQRSRSVASRSVAESVGKKSVFTNSDGRAVAGSTFINGAGTTGPNASAEADESLRARKLLAEENLTKKQKSKIARSESKSTKTLSKIIKFEGQIEQKALSVAVQELADLQKNQKSAVKRESLAHARHTKAVLAFHKAEEAFLLARTKFEIAQAAMNSEAEVLDLARQNARETTEGLAEKSQEVDGLRTMLGVDERERAVKLTELNPKRGFFSR